MYRNLQNYEAAKSCFYAKHIFFSFRSSTNDDNIAAEPNPTNVPLSNTTDHGANFRSDFQDFKKNVFDKFSAFEEDMQSLKENES